MGRQTAWTVTLFFVVACTSNPGGTSSSNCSIYSTCDACVRDFSCGWCNDRCVPGTSSGPSSVCAGYFAYTTSHCSRLTSDPCASSSTCADCAARGSCGWCAGYCLSGTTFRPDLGLCGSSLWTRSPSRCGGSGPSPTRCDFPNDASSCGCGRSCVSGLCRSCGTRGSGCNADDIYCCADANCPSGMYCDTISSNSEIGIHVCLTRSAFRTCVTSRDCFSGDVCSAGLCRNNN